MILSEAFAGLRVAGKAEAPSARAHPNPVYSFAEKALADEMREGEARAMMLRLAEDYNKLADRAENVQRKPKIRISSFGLPCFPRRLASAPSPTSPNALRFRPSL